MDDGFQNPTLQKDFSIVVINGEQGFGNKRVMPSGPLRESINRGLSRTNLVITTGDISDSVKNKIPKDRYKDFYKTSNFVSAIENQQGFKIACLEEISLKNNWIKKKSIIEAIKFYGNCEYSKYIKKIIS